MLRAPLRSADPSVSYDESLARLAERAAAAHSPAYVVVDSTNTILLFSGGTSKFLEPAGLATLDLMKLVHDDVAPELRALLRWSRATGRPGRTDGLVFATRGGRRVMSLVVEPLPATGDEPQRLMVLFQDGGSDQGALPGDQRGRIDRLESELRLTKLQVQHAAAKLSASDEEHQSSAEELEATNEELEASAERFQAANAELAARLAELDRISADIRHMVEATRTAIVFLDGLLRIRSFTPAVQDLFRLSEADRGRSITEIAAQIAYPELEADVCQVIQSQQPVEREVDGKPQGRRHLVRVLPYRSADASAAGAMVAFIDVTLAHQANQARRETEERLHRVAASVPAVLFIAGNTREWDYVNPPFYAFTGLVDGAALRGGWRACVHPGDWEVTQGMWLAASGAGGIMEHEIRISRHDDVWCWFLIRAVPQLDQDGQVLRWYGSCTDIDRRHRAERRQELALAELQLRVKTILSTVRSLLVRTLGSNTDLEHFAQHFAGRIGALARSQSAAARTPAGSVLLEELVLEELAAHGGQDERQTSVQGPAIALPAGLAAAVGLALHELTTNALKYGALSTPTGRVDVRWNIVEGDVVTIEWKENGVPLTDLSPDRHGFGRELIERGLPSEIGASTRLAFRPGGVFCQITFGLGAGRMAHFAIPAAE